AGERTERVPESAGACWSNVPVEHDWSEADLQRGHQRCLSVRLYIPELCGIHAEQQGRHHRAAGEYRWQRPRPEGLEHDELHGYSGTRDRTELLGRRQLYGRALE